MDSWALASDTSFAQITHIRASSYYGSADDVGTPGFRAGGALPVELSHFRPARDEGHWCCGDYMVDAIGVEQRWILYQAESASRWRVPDHQRNHDPRCRHDQREAVLYIPGYNCSAQYRILLPN